MIYGLLEKKTTGGWLAVGATWQKIQVWMREEVETERGDNSQEVCLLKKKTKSGARKGSSASREGLLAV